MTTYRQSLKTNKSSESKKLDLNFIGPIQPEITEQKPKTIEQKPKTTKPKTTEQKPKTTKPKTTEQKPKTIEQKPKTTEQKPIEPESIKPKRKIGKIIIKVDDVVYDSLSAGMRACGLLSPLNKSESKRSPSREAQYQAELKIWNKINNGIKKNEVYEYKNHKFAMIQ